MDAIFAQALFWTTRALELGGIVAIVLGIGRALIRSMLIRPADDDETTRFRQLRADIGRAILLGLEFLVAADIINTVAIEPTLDSLAVLAGIVVVRTFLSFALEVEITGRLPWRRDRAAAFGTDTG